MHRVTRPRILRLRGTFFAHLSTALVLLVTSSAACQDESAPKETAASELRDIGKIVIQGEVLRALPMPGRREGRVDIAKTLSRVATAGADSFVFAIGDGEHDWDDFKLLAAAADNQNIKLWTSFRLPSHRANSHPYKGLFEKWSTEIAAVAEKHPSVVAVLLPELEQGRNPKFVHPARCGTLRANLNKSGVSLLGSAFDPELQWIRLYENSLDGVVLRWTKFNHIFNLSAMLSGLEAMCPKRWKRLVAFETRPWAGSPEPPHPELIRFSLNIAIKRTDGVVLRQLDLRQPAVIAPTKDGNGAHFKELQAFSRAFRERQKR